MSELAQLVSDIQDVLASRDSAEKAEVLRLAAAYVRACRAVNEKAFQCRDLLRDGLRDQALNYAESEPPLAAGMEYLSFPERRAWVELCESMGLEMRQHDLNDDVTARVLDDLHPESEAYEGLLRTHRRLALGLAPISERLRVLRRLAELDRQRSFWEKDIRTFEEARAAELEEEAEQASAGGDLPRLENILTELESDVWLKLPPEEVIARVGGMITPHRTRSAAERFTRLAEQIREAHSIPDEHRARILIGQWSDFIRQSGIRPDPGLAGTVAATRAWLDELDHTRQEENEFREACLALELAIDENRPQGELEKLAAAVLRFGLDMPELLAARFNSRIRELQRSRGRKFKLALAGIIGALLIIAGSITFYVVKSSYQRRVQEWHAKIDRALTDGNLDIAGAHLETLRKQDPDVYAEPVIQNDLARYKVAEEQEEDRIKQFATAISNAEREVETFKATDPTVTLEYP
ncbi:MAG TPA: hypothetical protein VMY39_08225, partial [Planctomycetota bacterium]|nr:hypothetical protein [Planctomycetota bacterium]